MPQDLPNNRWRSVLFAGYYLLFVTLAMDQILSGRFFVNLMPKNILAKIAFSEVFEAATRDYQNTEAGLNARVLSRMRAGEKQEYDRDVLLFRHEIQRQRDRQRTGHIDANYSDSPTELDTDTEAQSKNLGMIWTGSYVFGFKPVPFLPDVGWTAGKGPDVDIILSTREFAKQHDPHLRSRHARFNFDRDTGAFFVTKFHRAMSAELAVNGLPVDRRIHSLNQHRMSIRISSFEYVLEYSGYAASDDFKTDRRVYMTASLQVSELSTFEMPTPLSQTRTIGPWTLGEALGKGAVGRVYFASNTQNEIVAIKVVERNKKTVRSVDREIDVLRRLTSLAQEHGEEGRIVRLKETLYPKGVAEFDSGSTIFEEVALVLEPMTPGTFDHLIANDSNR